jgi:hypothetical protein
MFSHFNLKTLLIICISNILAMNTEQEQLSLLSDEEEMIQSALRDVKNILLDFHCFEFDKVSETFSLQVPINFHPNGSRMQFFLHKPVMIMNLTPEEQHNTERTVSEILEFFESMKLEILKYHPEKGYIKGTEHFLFGRMNKTIALINWIEKEIIKLKIDPPTRDHRTEKIKVALPNLFKSILLVRYASFKDYTHISKGNYEYSLKFELANNIYSMAVQVLSSFRDFLNE